MGPTRTIGSREHPDDFSAHPTVCVELHTVLHRIPDQASRFNGIHAIEEDVADCLASAETSSHFVDLQLVIDLLAEIGRRLHLGPPQIILQEALRRQIDYLDDIVVDHLQPTACDPAQRCGLCA